MKKTLSILLMIVTLILGVYLIFKPRVDQFFTRSNAAQYKIANISASQLQKNAETSETPKETSSSSSDLVKKTDQFLSKFKNKHDLLVTGLVSIPELNINLPIFNNDSEDALTYGASNVNRSKMGEGNYSLASHHVFDGTTNRLFTPLLQSKMGTKVYVTDKSNIYTYEITEKFDVDQYAVEVLDNVEDKSIITLITCVDLNAEYRHIYRGKLIDVKKYESSPSDIRNSFEKEFNL